MTDELHTAVRNGYTHEVIRLLKLGADVAAMDAAGDTAAHHAARLEWVGTAMLDALLDAGADLRAVNRKGVSAIDLIKRRRRPAFMLLLIARGALPLGMSPAGVTVLLRLTPLQAAIRIRRGDIVDELMGQIEDAQEMELAVKQLKAALRRAKQIPYADAFVEVVNRWIERGAQFKP